jgi:predicted enzyme involved in methoxymalonyl-ACP biosynthesis
MAFLHGITRHARTAGCHSLRGEFVPGPRNQPMQQFLEKSGFILNPDGICRLELIHAPAAPAHLILEIC